MTREQFRRQVALEIFKAEYARFLNGRYPVENEDEEIEAISDLSWMIADTFLSKEAQP